MQKTLIRRIGFVWPINACDSTSSILGSLGACFGNGVDIRELLCFWLLLQLKEHCLVFLFLFPHMLLQCIVPFQNYEQ